MTERKEAWFRIIVAIVSGIILGIWKILIIVLAILILVTVIVLLKFFKKKNTGFHEPNRHIPPEHRPGPKLPPGRPHVIHHGQMGRPPIEGYPRRHYPV